MSGIPMRNVSLDEFARIVTGTTERDLESVVVDAAIAWFEDGDPEGGKALPLSEAVDALLKAREESK